MSAEESSAAGRLAAPLLSEALSSPTFEVIKHQPVHVGTVDSPMLALLREWLSAVTVTSSLAACMLAFGQPPSRKYAALGMLAFLLSQRAFRSLDSRLCHSDSLLARAKLWHLSVGWASVLAALTICGVLLDVAHLYPRHLVFWWFGLTPVALLLANYCAERHARVGRVTTRRHVIIGANGVGAELARHIRQSASLGKFMGFFDFRSLERLPDATRSLFAGSCKNLAAFVREHMVDAVYIALPISNTPRIEQLLQELRDTTASIYFVPNISAFDLIQPHYTDINGMAVVAICDTPFHGMTAVHKRVLDLLLVSCVLLLSWPLMILLAVLIKASSEGPVLFRQRRYGLHGEEIVIYKFRTMTVCEDSEGIAQAVRDDQRVTRIGRFLRRTSLDELPQIFNVLEGKMSFVGPRPHAVAHNEHYRRLINGYMIRHKIRPGITGWAQINGFRGETDTLEKMRRRVECDLDYLKNWSVWLDLRIISKTARMIFDDRNAY